MMAMAQMNGGAPVEMEETAPAVMHESNEFGGFWHWHKIGESVTNKNFFLFDRN
jgi:hypothetical protein